MRFFRYRRPSLNNLLGITAAKKRIKKDLGITALLKPFRWWGNEKRTIKRRVGYESAEGRLIRDGLPRAAGCSVMLLLLVIAVASLVLAPLAFNRGPTARSLPRGSGPTLHDTPLR